MDIIINTGSEAELVTLPTQKIEFVGTPGKDADQVLLTELREDLLNKLSLLQSSITLTVEQIALMVSKAEFDAVAGEVVRNKASIDLTAEQVALKASQTSVNTLTGKITNAEASILVNANAILSKANTSELNTLTQRLSLAESSILQTAELIASTVSFQELDALGQLISGQQTIITQTANSITSLATKTELNDQGSMLSQAISMVTQTTDAIVSSVSEINTAISGLPSTADIAAAEAAAKAYALSLNTAVTQEVLELQASLDQLDIDLTTSFRDGIISQTEASVIKSQVKIVENEKTDIDSQYTTIYGNTQLTGTVKAELLASKGEYDTAYTELINTINTAISTGTIDAVGAANVTSKFSAYRNALGVIAIRLNSAVNAIAQTKATKALTDSKAYTESIVVAINNEIADLSTAIQDLGGTIDSTFRDGIIEQAEGIAISAHTNIINAEKADIDAKYLEVYGDVSLTGTPKTALLSAKDSFNTAHNALITAINTAIADSRTSVEEKADVDSKFLSYRSALSALSAAFEVAIRTTGQAKIDASSTANNTYALAQATLAKTQVEAYADGIVDAEEQARIAQAQSNLNAAKQDATDKLAALKIGGRNYFIDGASVKSLSLTTSPVSPIGTGLPTYTEMAIAFDIRVISGAGRVLHTEFHGSVGATNLNITTAWTRVETVMSTTIQGDWYLWMLDASAVIEVKNLMFVKGNKPMDFSPAPEDVQEIINAVSTDLIQTKQAITLLASKETTDALTGQLTLANAAIAVNANAITSKVSQTDFGTLGTRVGAAESTIIQQATSISQKVSATDFTGTTIVSMINQSPEAVKISAGKIVLDGAVTANSVETPGTGPSLNKNNDNALKFKHDNGVIGLEIGIIGGVLTQNWYNANGVKVRFETAEGVVYVDNIPESWIAYSLTYTDFSAGTTEQAMRDGFYNASFMCNKSASTGTYIGIESTQTAYLYSAGRNISSEANNQYAGFKTNNFEKIGNNIEDGWYTYGNEYVGKIYDPGSINVNLLLVSGGVVIDTKHLGNLDLFEDGLAQCSFPTKPWM